MARIAINGLGRIGRAALKIILDTPELELVAANDIVPADNIAYLLKYDTVYGRYPKSVEVRDGSLVVDAQTIRYFSEKDPAALPGLAWTWTSCWSAPACSPRPRTCASTSRRARAT